MWIKSAAGAACHTAGINWSRLLTTEQLYFLLFVILPFTGFGLAVSGPVADAVDGGTANISFDVHGSWRDGHVRISAVKRGSGWVITGGVLKVDGERFRMPCAQTSSTTSCRLS